MRMEGDSGLQSSARPARPKIFLVCNYVGFYIRDRQVPLQRFAMREQSQLYRGETIRGKGLTVAREQRTGVGQTLTRPGGKRRRKIL